jgi:hypothetical protein
MRERLYQIRRFWRHRIVRTHYWCRCGASVGYRYRREHEEFHQALREFSSSPK